MYHPSLSEVQALKASQPGVNLAPVYRDVAADLETPVSAFLKVARGDHSFLLESVEGGERLARYSFIGTEPYRVLRCGPYATAGEGEDPLLEIERELSRFKLARVEDGLPRFTGGAVGVLAYEASRHFEPRVPIPAADPQAFPEALFMFTDMILVFDHLKHTIKVVAHCRLDGDLEASYRQACWRIDELVERLARPLPAAPYPIEPAPARQATVSSNTEKADFMRKVERCRDYIVAGDIYQVQVSQRFQRPTHAHPFSLYRALRTVNPSPYMYYLAMGDAYIIGASPEMLVRVEDGLVENHPIAGTRRRGRDAEDERRMEEELTSDEKERAEHIMLVDLSRNDVGRIAVAGSVQVTELMAVEKYSHVMHLVSHVVGRLRPELTSYDALRACFPAGTVTGAPKIRAMEIIAELENDRRGPYAGAVGYFDLSGNLDTAITIRTIVMKDGVAHAQAAGGIVYDSVPELEHMESQNKARAMLRAIDQAELIEEQVPTGSLGY
ncbi:MAG: anthranilate synthase component I [Dehalococcoidia bacterium]|nr:anthranilate synthase component I [Dehalococcoidia bacterium]